MGCQGEYDEFGLLQKRVSIFTYVIGPVRIILKWVIIVEDKKLNEYIHFLTNTLRITVFFPFAPVASITTRFRSSVNGI